MSSFRRFRPVVENTVHAQYKYIDTHKHPDGHRDLVVSFYNVCHEKGMTMGNSLVLKQQLE